MIFLEKVRRPDQRGLVRDRLTSRLAGSEPGIGPESLALVLGPPGSGKTTLLSHLAAAGTAAWYRLGAEDSDEAALTRHLGHTLAAALGDHSLIGAAAPGRIVDLIGALDGCPRRSVRLIVDDLQEIAGAPAERALETFLTMRPREVRIVLGSRRPPLINTTRLLVSGDLIELDSDDLRFRSWEVEQLFRTVYGTPLSPEGAAALTRRTGGWAAGLHLFHLSTARCGRLERERAIDELNGRSRLIRSYLARNVLGGLDADRHRFLLLTSALGVLTGDLCDDLLDSCGSATVLAALEEEQFFTTSTDGGVTYRYHQVLQTQLEVLLVDELGSRGARKLYERAARLLEEAGRVGPAVHAYARADDWGSVARLMTPRAVPGADDGVSGLLSLPGVPSDDPCLILAEARLFTRRGRLVEAIAAYRRAEDLLDDPDFRRGCVAERQSAALWLAGQPPPVDRIPIGISAVSAELRSLTRTPTAEVTGVLPRALQLIISGELDGAVAVLAEPPSGGGWQPLAVRLAQHWIDLARGAEEHQAGEVEATLLEAEFDGWPWLARLAQGLQTGMLLASGAWEWRCASAMELLDTLRRQHDPWTECLTALAIGVGLAHSGAADLATSAFARASSLADDLFAPSLRLWAERLSLGTTRTQQPSPHPAALHPSPTGSKAIVLTCLGGFSLTVDGTAVDWLTLRPRARSLLMLLSLHHARPMHREHLIESLWPRSELASGIRCLQVAASSIRQCLSAAGLSKDALAREGDSYVLRLDGALDQLRSFERLVADAEAATGDSALRLRSAALALYPGDLLPEAGPAEWVVEERDRLRRTAAAVAKAAAVDALTSEGPRSALEYARRSVALDQYQDLSWDLVIECHTQLGDHAAAAVARRDQARAWADLGLPL